MAAPREREKYFRAIWEALKRDPKSQNHQQPLPSQGTIVLRVKKHLQIEDNPFKGPAVVKYVRLWRFYYKYYYQKQDLNEQEIHRIKKDDPLTKAILNYKTEYRKAQKSQFIPIKKYKLPKSRSSRFLPSSLKVPVSKLSEANQKALNRKMYLALREIKLFHKDFFMNSRPLATDNELLDLFVPSVTATISDKFPP